MNANVNLPAPLSVSAFLGFAAVLMLCLALVVGFAASRKRGALRATAAASIITVAVYSGLLLLFSVASNQVMLEKGQEKYFCELDCHLAYSVLSAGYEADPQVAGDTRYVIEVQTRFDPTTISPHRGKGPLTPTAREAVLIDHGREIRPAEVEGQSLATPLRPGESYRTKLIFEVQGTSGHPFLWLHTRSDAPDWMMIGNELSPLHRRVLFKL
jgi:hypothetical protein